MASVIAMRIVVAVVLLLALAALAWGVSRRTPGVKSGAFLDHVEELRKRILRMVAALVIGVLFVFSFRLGPNPWWLPRPALHDTLAAQIFNVLREHLVPAGVEVVALRPMDGLSAEMTISLAVGAIIAMPFWLGQLGAFVAPALKPQEKRALALAIGPAAVLFLAGFGFALWWITPALLDALYGYAFALDARPLISVSQVITFATTMGLLFGAAFQTPLVMTVLSRVGLVSAKTWAKLWRHAVIVILILCAFVVDGTIITFLLVATPIFLLYVLGIMGAAALGKPR